jgi:hippurate hydrolase
MDALCIAEETGTDFCSRNPGFMHACGHDGHMSMLLATAQYAAELRDRGALPVSVVILFQPCEESASGALRMIEEGGA